MEKGSTNNEDVFKSPSALFMICFIGSFLPFFHFPLLSFFPRASSSCLLLKWFFFFLSTGLPQFLQWFVRYFLHSLLTLFLSFCSACFHPFMLSCLLPTHLAFFLPFLASFLVFCFFLPCLPFFLSFFLLFSLPRLLPSIFFVWVKPSYKASVWDALQYLLCEKPAWHAETMSFFLLSFPFFVCITPAKWMLSKVISRQDCVP